MVRKTQRPKRTDASLASARDSWVTGCEILPEFIERHLGSSLQIKEIYYQL
jgi:hypothetical protein